MRVTYTLCPQAPSVAVCAERTRGGIRRTSHIELVRIPADRWNDRVDAAMRKRLEALLSDAAPKWRRDYRFF